MRVFKKLYNLNNVLSIEMPAHWNGQFFFAFAYLLNSESE